MAALRALRLRHEHLVIEIDCGRSSVFQRRCALFPSPERHEALIDLVQALCQSIWDFALEAILLLITDQLQLVFRDRGGRRRGLHQH